MSSIILFYCRHCPVLHPAFKTTYFRNHKWPEEWIEEAVGLLRADWRANYKPSDTAASNATSSTNTQVSTLYIALSMESILIIICQSSLRQKYCNAILQLATSMSLDALEAYLAAPTSVFLARLWL
jgi:hypothetical protein